MKRYWLKRMAVVTVVFGMLMCSSGCSGIPLPRERLPEDTLEEFETAYNAMDIDGMLECLDESTIKTITTGMDLVLGITGAITGMDLEISAEDLISLIPLFSSLQIYDAEDYPKIDFMATETLIKGDRATVHFTEMIYGESTLANMVKKDGKWYITIAGKEISEEEADRILIPGEGESWFEEENEEKESFVSTDSDMLGELFDQFFGLTE